MKRRNLVIVGAGDVVMNRYIAALLSLKEESLADVSAFLDVSVSDQKRELLNQSFPNADVHQLSKGSSEEVCAYVKRFPSSCTIVILATPPNWHADMACDLLSMGYFVAIEKPMVASVNQLVSLRNFLNEHGTARLFLFSYYALEKGLPLLLLSGVEGIPRKAFDLTSPSHSHSEWSELRSSLGRVIEVSGALLEGVGGAGTLAHRQWVLQGDLGGNTVETFYHLVTLAVPFLCVESLLFRSDAITLGWSDEISHDRAPKDNLGETLTLVNADAGSIRLRLACAKYVSESSDQRWMAVQFANGSARMDFLTGQLCLELPGRKYNVALGSMTKYQTQFRLLFDAVERDAHCEMFPLFSKSLEVTFDIRNAGLHSAQRPLRYTRLETHLFDFIK